MLRTRSRQKTSCSNRYGSCWRSHTVERVTHTDTHQVPCNDEDQYTRKHDDLEQTALMSMELTRTTPEKSFAHCAPQRVQPPLRFQCRVHWFTVSQWLWALVIQTSQSLHAHPPTRVQGIRSWRGRATTKTSKPYGERRDGFTRLLDHVPPSCARSGHQCRSRAKCSLSMWFLERV